MRTTNYRVLRLLKDKAGHLHSPQTANRYETTVRTSLQDGHAPVIDGTAADLPDSLSQPRANDLARLELQRWRQDANHRNFKIGPCQIEHVNGNTASFQSLVNSLETNGGVVRNFA